ncbi:MAG: hypothetical protein ACRD59_10230 [Candidatus Acidiferrales bacterium]
MDHSEAVRLKAAEKYLLGELSAELRDQYEDHYFGCIECAQDIRAGAALIDNARDVWSSEPIAGAVARPAREAGGGWWAVLWRPAFAVPVLALLVLFAGYQNAFTIPQLKSALSRSEAPQALASFSLIAQNSRGSAPLTIAAPAGKPFSLFLDIPPQSQFTSYVCEFQSEAGVPELSLNISAEEAKQTVQLLIPAGRLASGKHLLVVRGLGSPESADADKIGVVRYPFSLEYTQ